MGSNPIGCANVFGVGWWLLGAFFWVIVRVSCTVLSVTDTLFCIDQDGIWGVLGLVSGLEA